MVIDKETGQTPPTAAERMDIHDRKMGVEPIRPAKPSVAPDISAAARAESGLSARPAPVEKAPAPMTAAPANRSGRDRIAAAVAERNKRPWNNAPNDRPALKASPASARSSGSSSRQAGGRKTIVTGKWWDSKGPRTIELGPKGQQVLSSGFVTLAIGLVIAAIVTMLIEPFLLFAGAFVLFRFGGNILGPIGAGFVDKALAEKG